MAGLPFDKARLNRFAGRLVARYVKFVYQTSRVVSEPADTGAFAKANHPFILAMWHGQFMMLPAVDRGRTRVRSMVARHGDAELIGQVLDYFDMPMIRGAGAGGRQRDRGGAQALREAVRTLAGGDGVAMTADIPPGPARVAGTGIVTLARMSGRPVMPVAVATRRYKSFDTWSRMTLNLPFNRLAVVAGGPILVARDADEDEQERARLAIQDELNRVTARAYELAGADPKRATPPSRDPNAPPAEPGISLRAYRTFARLAKPAAPLLLRSRAKRGKEDTSRRNERLGQPLIPRPDGCLAWVHAASVGETNAVLPLLPALRERRPDIRFLLTTGTATSAEVAARRLGPQDIHQYIPLDVPDFVGRFLDHWKPDIGILTESEIWPNLLFEAASRDIPLALVNARVSPRSFSRWRRSPSSARAIFNRFSVVLAQNELLSRRFADLGARRVLTAGDLKADAPPPHVDTDALNLLKQTLASRPHIVAASTHEGEEDIIAAAHKLVAKAHPGFCTIIVPRHPDRGGSIAELMRKHGLTVSQRSQDALPEAGTSVYIADTLGELGTFYALSPIAFVGGSLVPKGGHNPIEAIRHGAAVITGPHWINFSDAYRALLRQNAAKQISTAQELADTITLLMEDGSELARMRASADAALEGLSGALQRTVDALLPFLPDREGLRRAS